MNTIEPISDTKQEKLKNIEIAKKIAIAIMIIGAIGSLFCVGAVLWQFSFSKTQYFSHFSCGKNRYHSPFTLLAKIIKQSKKIYFGYPKYTFFDLVKALKFVFLEKNLCFNIAAFIIFLLSILFLLIGTVLGIFCFSTPRR